MLVKEKAVKSISCALLLACGLLFQSFVPALAEDSGDENVVPVTEWKCWNCDKQFFTFQSDDIAADSKLEHKDFAYQQKAWVLLSNPGTPLPKCEKVKDGAHCFDKVRDFNTSPYTIMQRRSSYIVLKEGGQAIKARLIKLKCIGATCGYTAWCFDGDDLDLDRAFVINNKNVVRYFMNSGTKVGECGVKLYYKGEVTSMPWHLFGSVGYMNPTSYGLAQNLNSVICSD